MISNFENRHPKIDKSAFIARNATVIGEVEIARNASVWFGAVIRGDVNFIKIGENSNIQDLACLHVWHREIDENGKITDTGYPCIIEKKCHNRTQCNNSCLSYRLKLFNRYGRNNNGRCGYR